MDQLSFFDDEILVWIASEDCGCRMWQCPSCFGRLEGSPLSWHQQNPYHFCPYCGIRLFTRSKDLR